MPKIKVNGAELFYTDTGVGDETIVFSHGLLMSHRMFDAQVAVLRDRYRCVAYDHRGQGQSQIARDGYDMETVYLDAVNLLAALGCVPCHFVGLSMGGFVGMRLAARKPNLLKSLILLETSADPEAPENVPRYNLMRLVGRWLHPRLIARPAAQSLFGQTFLKDPSRVEERKFWIKHLGSVDRFGATEAAKGVFTRQPVIKELEQITVPTLIIVGEEDVATVPEKAERIHERVAGSKLVRIPKAGHSSSIEAPDAVTHEITTFLDSLN